MTRLRFVTASAILIVVTALGVSPAWAAAPTNDTSSGATAASIGFSEVLDTTEATTDAQDAQFADACGYTGPTDASVWYTFEDNDAEFVVVQAGYEEGDQAVVLVGVGSPGSLQAVTCSLDEATFDAEPGTTYYILVADTQCCDPANGGILHISVFSGTTTAALTVNPKGTASKSMGTVHITGSYTCTNAYFGGGINGTITQTDRYGNPFTTELYAYDFDFQCDGGVHTWNHVGAGIPGVATVEARINVCYFRCADAYASQVVKLRARR